MSRSSFPNSFRLFVLVLAFVWAAAPAGIASAQSACTSPAVTLDYDHFNENQDVAFPTIVVTAGEEIQVEVKNTCKAAFTYAHEGIARAAGQPPAPGDADATGCDVAGSTVSICIRHEERFGAYRVDIRLKPGESGDAVLDGKPKELLSVTLTIPVENSPWSLDFSSGFTVSRLTDPVFAGKTTTENDTEVTRIVRDRAAEDDRNLGVAAFTHLTHESWGSPRFGYFGPSLGLGIDERNEASYFVGLSWLWGRRGALTAGYHWGSVDRLPAGMADGDTIDDVNVLGDLPSRVDGAFFFSLSFSFLGGRERFESKVADAGTRSGPAVTTDTEEETEQQPAPGNGQGTGMSSNPQPLPAKVENLAATRSGDIVSLTWDEVADATYEVLRGTACGALFLVASEVEEEFSETAEATVAFFYAVRAVKDGVPGPSSDCIEAAPVS